MLINYSFSKFYHSQFSPAGLYTLNKPYGDFIPFGLAWTYMGHSYGFNLFMGIAELLGVLLLFRKTKEIGAIISIGTVLNIMAVNYFYDAPVKLLSTHLLVMLLFLLAPSFSNLIKIFFKGGTGKMYYQKRPDFKKSIWNLLLNITKYAVIIGMVVTQIVEREDRKKQPWYRSEANKSAMHGWYDVDEFYKNGEELTHFRDSIRWDFMMIEQSFAGMETMNGKYTSYKFELDTTQQVIQFEAYRDSTDLFTIHYQELDSTYQFDFVQNTDSIRFFAKRKTEDDYLLNSKPFRWIFNVR